ncbi:MAG: hypothetical protein ACREJO_04905 [Phycisphaerales bacterium]
MFATDRHLVLLEPNLFSDVAFFGQRLVPPTACSVSGATLTISGVDFAALGVAAGNVVLLDGVPLEVIARLNATQLTVSRLRAAASEATITPPSGSSASISTFRHQLVAAHEQLLGMIGIGAGALPGEDALTESRITNADALWRLETLLTLRDLYRSLVSRAGGDTVPWAARANFYAKRFDAERQRTLAAIDTDGDGIADVARYFSLVRTMRG